MPARTNDFQKLVKVINHHLAPKGAKITESAMLYDREAEIDREVDILVESTLLNCNIKIGVECTAVKSGLDVRSIESFSEKHRKLGINQTIVVSKYGFSESAKRYASKNNIKLLTFNSAKSENWSKNFERLQGMSVYGRNYFLKEVSIVFGDEAARARFKPSKSTQVFFKERWISLEEYAADLFVHSKVSEHAFKELKENEANGSDPRVELGFNLEGKIQFRDELGETATPLQIVFRMGYKTNYRNLDSRQVSYDGRDIVVGGFFDKQTGTHAHLVVNDNGERLEGTLEVGGKFFPDLA